MSPVSILFPSTASSTRLQDMFSRYLQDMSSTRLQHVFSVTIFRLPRRVEDVFKTSWKTSNCYAEDVLMTSSRPTNVCWDSSLKLN